MHVIFSAPGLKIHAKLFLISRKENGEVVRYAHIGTGNFNEKTARLYTDYSLLTADARITNEVRRVFNFIENPYRWVTFDYLMVSPQNSRRLLYEMVDREIANAQQGLPSGITLKLNNLVDKGLVDRLYAASSSGVPVNLLVRGMCSLIPNLEGISDNIRAISIVDRYLEHDRVYIFENGGDKKVYLSSADWMTRNLVCGLEVATPLLDPRLKQRVLDIIDILFSDTVKARYIDKELSNRFVPAAIAAKYGRSWRFMTTSNHSNNLNNPMPIHDKSPRPQEFAAVKSGSNSFHMVILRVVDGAMQVNIGRLKQRVHLADGLGPDNMLSKEAMTRGLNCLSLFAERLQGFSPASVCIVGTHTLRQALNATDFLKRAGKGHSLPD